MENLAPIILFVYNRPLHTQKVVEGLLTNPEAKDSVLYIFADGPKPTISKEGLESLKQVREYIHTIKGFKEIYIDESEQNKGLANATIRGCTQVINKHGKIIVIEDDDVPNQYFLSYINRCLIKYENDEKIWCISGYTDTSIMPPRGKDDLFLVNRPSSWGFGTWKRCWDKIIWDINTLKGLFEHQSIIDKFNKWGGVDHSIIMFGLFEGMNNSWSIRFHFAAFLNHTYTILPQKSLIQNIGCDGSGTHCGFIEFKIQTLEREVVIPEIIEFDKIRNKQLRESFIPKSLSEKITYKILLNIHLRKVYPFLRHLKKIIK